ncbi:MAG TPA: hypothetical protein VEL12_04645 [Candidatus Nitrosopolaris sp.]|nr:hypothetical protein [Candidatus Nitrosopolaris sp.]
MGNATVLQFSLALFAGMAAAMVVPPVHRSVPRWMEAAIWLGLIVTCWLVITNIQQLGTRKLTESAAWGADQIVNTSIGLMFAGMLGWVVDHRFAIADAVVLLVGADIMALVLIRSHRKALDRRPRIMLGEWIELPLHGGPVPAPAAAPYVMDEWNRRAEHGTAMLAAAFLTWFVQMLIWTRDVVIPQAKVRQARAVEAGRVQAAAGLEALRERAFQLEATARSWHAEHTPAINGLAVKAGQALAVAGGAGLADLQGERALTADHPVNISALLSAQSIGWYGPIVPAPSGFGDPDREEGREDESDRLAS